MTKKTKRSSREKRILVGSLLIAVVISAGSTFAWFTSKDEVTNRLSAKADYGVSITETFTPPSDWVPGQEVNKDVYMVNTGNVDAYVKALITANFRINYEGKSTEWTNGALPDKDNIVHLNEKYTVTTDAQGREVRTADEVTSIQAGATIAWAPEDAKTTQKKYVKINGEYVNCEVYKDGDTEIYKYGDSFYKNDGTATTPASPTAVLVPLAGTTIAVDGSKLPDTPASNPELDPDNDGTDMNKTSNFKPTVAGLYVFRRAINPAETNSNMFVMNVGNFYYSAYYYDGAHFLKVKSVEDLSIYTDGSDAGANGILTGTPKVTFAVNKNDTIDTTDTTATNYTWAYSAAEGDQPAKITFTYKGANDTATSDDTVIIVKLANIGTTGDSWKASDETADTVKTFYYNKLLEAGYTSAQLIDSVTLSEDTTNDAYIDFDFDLNVIMKSAQVTYDDNSKPTATAVVSDTANWKLIPTSTSGVVNTSELNWTSRPTT